MMKRAQLLRLLFLAITLLLLGSMLLISAFGLWRLRSEAITNGLETAAMHSRNLDHLDRMANLINTSIFVKNGPCIAGLGFGGEGWTSMTISTPTGEGVTNASSFVRLRRCVMVDHFRIV